MLADSWFTTRTLWFSSFLPTSTFSERDLRKAMIDSGAEPDWLSVAEASRALGISETAVRKRIRVGTLPTREHRGRKEVRISVDSANTEGSQPVSSAEFNHERSLVAARLAGELAELRARLVDVQRDRDRWHQLALETRDEVRAAEAARAAMERELRLLLART